MSISSLRSFEYLEKLPGTVLFRLYQQPSAVLAIFRRMLPPLAKTFVMAVLFLPEPISMADLNAWVRASSTREKDHGLALLEQLHIFLPTHQDHTRGYKLSDAFAKSLRMALTGGGNHNSFGVPDDSRDPHPITIPDLDKYARRQWEQVLGYMVGSTNASLSKDSSQVSPSVRGLLQMGDLVVMKGKRPEITEDGFAFVLQEVNAQVWTILILYLENAEAASLALPNNHKPNPSNLIQLQMDPVDVLSFLFMLGSLELGQGYSKASLTATQKQMLDDLADYGIIYQHSNSSSRFYPTRLATTLTSDAGALKSLSSGFDSTLRPGNSKGFIIIETNYRLYAYTSSELEIAVISLFAKLSSKYPNLVTGKITRESIRNAVSMGITSEQIIAYLSTHAHPQMRKTNPVLPPTVVDQIRLWQIEGERMKSTPGFLFKDFRDNYEYQASCKIADDNGVMVYRNDAKRLLFVTKVEQLQAFFKKNKEREKQDKMAGA
ncbi:MAG: RNA polymerase II transcription factor B 52 kDa subunit [Cirrosporium novae-zelandiae]|nr:MAG: RNA polymerase II transcription factor B 52 kDa subunit [Cirrosporium novae-zelandiae]